MRVVSIASSLALLGAIALAVATAKSAKKAYLDVTKLVIDKIDDGNTTLFFHIYDPNPLTNASTACNGTWLTSTTGNPQESYRLCNQSKFAWAFDSYKSFDTFTLKLEHRYTDPAVGKPPYDQMTVYAKAPVNTTDVIDCHAGAKPSCKQKPHYILHAPIYADVA